MKHTLPWVAVAAAAAAVLTLSACGGNTTGSGGVSSGASNGAGSMMSTARSGATASSPAGSSATGAHNNAEVAFTTDMIPHHAQAVAMADLAIAHGTDLRLKELAIKIKAAQAPEIKTMSGWMTNWGMSIPAMGNAHGMGSMGAGNYGMMTDAQMGALGNARGVAFDRLWLQTMIKHHQGAIAMSRIELAQGSNPEAKKLAQAVIDAQSAEITSMNSMLTNMGR